MAKSKAAAGRTRWKRFGLALIPTTAVISGLMVAAANGAIPVSFAISGTAFKVSGDKMVATDVVQYGNIAKTGSGNIDDAQPTIYSGFAHAEFDNLCQSVKVPFPFNIKIKGHDSVVMVIKSGGKSVATDMVADLSSMKGDATFNGVQIGIDAKTADKGPLAHTAPMNGMFGQQVEEVIVVNPRQIVYGVSAASFRLPNLDLSVNFDNKECF